MRAAATHACVWTMLVVACAAAPAPARAQDLGDNSAAPANEALSPDESAALGAALPFDPSTLAGGAPAKPLRLPSMGARPGLDVSRTDRPDGSSTVVVKQPLPIDWDAKVGADLGLSPTPNDRDTLRQPLPDKNDGRGSGAAWASVGLPNFATLDARVDPTNDQGRLGTTLKHSMPVGSQFSLTLQNSLSVTETFSASAAAPPVPQVWGNEKLAKFDILPTGTTLAAGLASTSTDPLTHNKLSAEQKLYGPLHVTTAVTDVGQTTSNKSITAGFKLHW